jgi:hypothetical protein
MEGFGNQFVESVYFRKPVILTPYPVYKSDIKPLGFEVIEMEESVKNDAIDRIDKLINDPEEVKKLTNTNFKIGKENLSYKIVEKKLKDLMENMNL